MKLLTTIILLLTFFNSFSQDEENAYNQIGKSNANNRNINHKDGAYFQDLKRSTLNILPVNLDGTVSSSGTGTLINTVSNSFVGTTKKYYILTANHLFDKNNITLKKRDEIYISFDYELPNATDRGIPSLDFNIAYLYKIPVSTVVLDTSADIVLLEVNPSQLSPAQRKLFDNAYAAGWSTNHERATDDYINISHPAGDHKKIFTKPSEKSRLFSDYFSYVKNEDPRNLKLKVFGSDFNNLNTILDQGASGSAFFDTSNFKYPIAGVLRTRYGYPSLNVNIVSLLENSWKLSGTNGLQHYLDPDNTWISQIPGGYVKKTIINESTTSFDLSLSEKGHYQKDITLDLRNFFDILEIGKRKEDLLGAGGMIVSSGTDKVYLTVTPSDDPNYLFYGVEYDSSNTNDTQEFQGNSWNIKEPPTSSFPGVSNPKLTSQSNDIRSIKNYHLNKMWEASKLNYLLSYIYKTEVNNKMSVSIDLSTLNDEPSTTSVRAVKLPRHMPYNAVELFDDTKFEKLWRSKAYPDSRGLNSDNLYINAIRAKKTISSGNNGGYLNMVNSNQVLGPFVLSEANLDNRLNIDLSITNNGGVYYYKVWVDFIPVVDTNNQYNFVDDSTSANPNTIELVAEGESSNSEVSIFSLMPTADVLGLNAGEEKYYRLRIAVSDENNISQNGFYQNGEVEDYLIKVSVPSSGNPAPPRVAVADTLDFGKVSLRKSISKDIQIKNLGEQDLIVSNLSIPSGFTYDNAFGEGTVIQPADSLSFSVGMITTTLGAKSGNLTFDTNDPANPSVSVALTGEVVMLSRLKFENNLVDENPANVFTPVGTLTYSDTEKAQGSHAVRIDAPDNFVQLPGSENSPLIKEVIEERTIAFWFKADTIQQSILYDEGGSIKGISFRLEPDGIRFGVKQRDINIETILGVDCMKANEWYHVAGIFNQGVLQIYINGVLKESKDVSGLFTQIELDRFGIGVGGIYSSTNYGNRNDSSFKGYLDDLQMYSSALTAAEITTLVDSAEHVTVSDPCSTTSTTFNPSDGPSVIPQFNNLTSVGTPQGTMVSDDGQCKFQQESLSTSSNGFALYHYRDKGTPVFSTGIQNWDPVARNEGQLGKIIGFYVKRFGANQSQVWTGNGIGRSGYDYDMYLKSIEEVNSSSLPDLVKQGLTTGDGGSYVADNDGCILYGYSRGAENNINWTDEMGGYASGSPVGGARPALEQKVILSPNPTTGKISLGFETFSSGEMTFAIMSVDGRLLSTVKRQVTEGDQVIQLDAEHLIDGLYFVKGVGGGTTFSVKFTVQKK